MLRQTIIIQDNMKIDSYTAWATPFYATKLEEFIGNYNKSLIDYSYSLQKNNPQGRNKSNKEGWQSQILDPNSNELRPLCDKIFELCKNVKLNIKTIKIPQIWININPKGGYNIVHQHGQYHISGTYYVKIPENSGYICHRDPRPGAMTNGFFNDRFDDGEIRLTHNYEGLLLIWPSFIDHFVLPNESDEDRITISFDIIADV